MAYDNFLIDKRVVERNLAKGLVDSAALKKQIESLPDSEANCVRVNLEGDGGHADVDDMDDLDDELDEPQG